MPAKDGEHPYGHPGQLLFLFIFMDALLLDKFYFKMTWLPLRWLRLTAAVVLLLLSMVLMYAGHKALFQSKPASSLITNGVFKFVRHPLYLSILLFYFSFTLFFNSRLGLILLLPGFVLYNYLAAYEEQFLSKKFPDAYAAYKKRTGRWWPKFK